MEKNKLFHWNFELKISKNQLLALLLIFIVLTSMLGAFLGFFIYNWHITNTRPSPFPPQKDQFCSDEGDWYLNIIDMQYYNKTGDDNLINLSKAVGYFELLESNDNGNIEEGINTTSEVYIYNSAGHWTHLDDITYPVGAVFDEIFMLYIPFFYNNYNTMYKVINYTNSLLIAFYLLFGCELLNYTMNQPKESYVFITFESSIYEMYYYNDSIVEGYYYGVVYSSEIFIHIPFNNNTLIFRSEYVVECNTGIPLYESISFETIDEYGFPIYTQIVGFKTILTIHELPRIYDIFNLQTGHGWII